MQVEKLKTIDADTLLSTPMRKTLFVVGHQFGEYVERYKLKKVFIM